MAVPSERPTQPPPDQPAGSASIRQAPFQPRAAAGPVSAAPAPATPAPVVPAAPAPDPRNGKSTAERFRPDLEGLRGVAILLVVAFHAGIVGFGGGFVGVDVFFVLSGFLITGLLLRELERTGTVDLMAFYARRARRILPASAVVLVVTLVASAVVLSPLDVPRVAGDGVAVALSAGNIRFALESADYFAADQTPSPLLHYWSLGVEEQFYLLWPTLLLLGVRVGRRVWGTRAVLALTLILSYLAALWLTSTDQPWAFYSLPTRAWQLSLGGLIAAGAVSLERVGKRPLEWLGWLGLAAIVAAAVLIDPRATPYPGLVALVPTLGTAAVIASGVLPGVLAAALAHPWLRFLGKISFSLYLVHWPLLILPLANQPLGYKLPLLERLGLVVACVVVAWASYRFVEQPFHRGRRLVSVSALRTVAAGVSTICVTAALALGFGFYGTQALAVTSSGPGPSASVGPAWTPPPAATPTPLFTAPASGASLPVPTNGGSLPPPTASAPPTPTPVPTIIGPQPLPANLQPPLARAREDWEALQFNNCLLNHSEVRPRDHCVYGDPDGDRTIVLVGDSHATQWFPALNAIALAEGWRLVAYGKYNCPLIDAQMYGELIGREYFECTTWRNTVIEQLNAMNPDLVVVGMKDDLPLMDPTQDDPRHKGEAMARLLNQVPGQKVILVDTPRSNFDVPACVARNVDDVGRCETSRSDAFLAGHLLLEQTAATASGAIVADLSDTICWRDPCPVISGNILMWRDRDHFTATYATSLAGALFALLPPLD